MFSFLQRINAYLVRWIRKKYKRLSGFKKAKKCWDGITRRYPRMFAHWRCATTVCATLSATVGTPSIRVPPPW
jgi:hypothetical protein